MAPWKLKGSRSPWSSDRVSSSRFVQESLRHIRERILVQPGMKVLVACSGGLDSSVLADFLVQVSRLLQIDVELAHVDHRTRALASERESRWVHVLAQRIGVKAHSLSLATEEGVSKSQAEMRDLRRRSLLALAEDIGAGAIATAHHADDNAETFLMRALSGSGSRGLTGIPAKDGIWIRPLLWATRAELESYARERGLAWVEDPSNSRGDYLRNRLRQEALPLLEDLRAGSVKNMARLAERLEDEEVEVDTWLGALLEDKGGMLPLGWLERWPRALQRRALAVWTVKQGIEYDPQLVETLLRGEEVIHPVGSFLRRADFLVFTPEAEFGESWSKPIPVELGRRISLGASMAWSFLPSAPGKLRNLDWGVYFVFRDPRSAQVRGPGQELHWSKTPWPLAIRKKLSSEAEAVDRYLRQAGIPKPYWKNWPIVADAQNLDRRVAVLGIAVEKEFEPEKTARRLHIDSFFDERLNALSHPC